MKFPANISLKERARELRKNSTLAEVLFWNVVKNKQICGLDFDRQRIIGNYIVDFFCGELNLVIEIDGESHDNKQEYDQARDDYLASWDLNIWHISDIDVKRNMNAIIQQLKEYCETTPARHRTRCRGHPFTQ